MAEYERRDCRGCDGSGQSFDITTQDAVFPGANPGQCGGCAGRGHTLHRVPPPEVRAALEREALERAERLATQEVGDMPAWMC